jgi:cytochrome o ubiquinol oxidase subunit 3
MSTTTLGLPPVGVDPYRVGRTGRGRSEPPRHHESGPAPKRIVVGYEFWIFLLSDIVMFSTFFAAHGVLRGAFAGGPTGHDLFAIPRVALETALLLTSSFAGGLAAVAMESRHMLWTQAMLLITGLLGLGFLLLEANESAGLVARGAGPDRSGFLSSFFALVGCHGLHVTAGLLWLGTMMAQIFVKGFTPRVYRRMLCFNLFWHALDIIWVAVFTFLYRYGIAARTTEHTTFPATAT